VKIPFCLFLVASVLSLGTFAKADGSFVALHRACSIAFKTDDDSKALAYCKASAQSALEEADTETPGEIRDFFLDMAAHDLSISALEVFGTGDKSKGLLLMRSANDILDDCTTDKYCAATRKPIKKWMSQMKSAL
jgi:hypothetical protein